MSKLEELIQELCPNGVEYESLNDVCDKIYAGGTPSTSHEDYYDGNIPWIRSGEINFNSIYQADRNITELGLANSSAKWIESKSVVMAMTGATVARSAVTEIDLTANQSVCALIPNRVKMNYKFLYYCISNMYSILKSKGQGALTSLNLQMIKEVKVPAPPMEVQSEIVRILDNFTLLTAELTAELTARKEQYKYYRDYLFDFEQSKVNWITIENLFDIKGGYTPSKDKSKLWENGTIPWFRVDDINKNGRILYDSNLHITKSAVKKNGPFLENSIIITTSATIGEYALIKVPFVCNQRFTCLTLKEEYKNKFNMKFLLYYCYKLSIFCKDHLNKGNFASVDMAKFKKFKFPVIDINKQNEIVDLLDKFEEYCSDITQGLPAEIELRKQQYEYYRDKLLTFKELE